MLFLDIQMPGIDGFEVIRRRTPERMPAVVFLTAYDQFAMRAFEAEAHDYLVKPVSEARFAATMKRLAQAAAAPAARRAREPAIVVSTARGATVLPLARDRLDRGGRQLRASLDRRPQLSAARVARATGAAGRRARLRPRASAGARPGGRRARAARRGRRSRRGARVRHEGPGLAPPPRRVLRGSAPAVRGAVRLRLTEGFAGVIY